MAESDEECGCPFQDVSQKIELDKLLPKNKLELSNVLLEMSRKFVWDMAHIWNPRFQFIDTQVTIKMKICSHEGIRLLLFVHPKSRDVHEEHSLWLQRPIFFPNKTTNFSIVRKKMDILFREVVDQCQLHLMQPNTK